MHDAIDSRPRTSEAVISALAATLYARRPGVEDALEAVVGSARDALAAHRVILWTPSPGRRIAAVHTTEGITAIAGVGTQSWPALRRAGRTCATAVAICRGGGPAP